MAGMTNPAKLNLSVTRIRPVHCSNLSCNNRPVEFSVNRLPPLRLLLLIPFHQFIHEPEMRLNDNIESPRSYKTTRKFLVSDSVGYWKLIDNEGTDTRLTMLLENSSLGLP